MKRRIKTLLQKSGVYPLVRAWYRRVSPFHRKERSFNRRFYGELIRARDLCFDIGANVGQTVEALLLVDATVVAVEPNPNCLPTLKHQFGDHPRLTIVRKAVGAAAGFAELHFSGTESTASIREDWSAANDEVLRIEVTTLDALIREFGRPDFVKVDVEGFELEVFEGLTQPIPLICFEMHDHEMELVRRILRRLSSLGEIAGVNVVSGDNSRWLLDRWVTCAQLFEAAAETLPRQANIVVKMNPRA